jgi:transposase
MEKTVEQLEQKITVLEKELETLRLKNQQSEEAYNRLLHSFKEFQRHIFGSKSERFIDNNQGDLFASEPTVEAPKEQEDNIIHIEAHNRRKKKNKFPKDLPRKEVIIKADRICSCGREKHLIRYETTELLNYIPAVFEIIEQKREVLACSCGSIITAPNPPRILPKVQVTNSLLAHVIVSKLHDRQPLYHLEKVFSERFGIDLSRNNLARWFIKSAEQLQPLINLMKDEIIDYDIASCDPTSIQVLAEPNRKPTQKSYWFCMRGGPPDKAVILYDYNDTQHKQFLADWFRDFTGTIHVDAQNIFDDLLALLAYCNAHARRKFEAIAKITKTEGLATQALRFYSKLYKIERDLKSERKLANMTANQFYQKRYSVRQDQSKPIMIEFKTWLDENCLTVLPQSPLGKAFAYVINHWEGLTRFLEDGRLEIDNNHTEREIKPAVTSRKNFLFAKSVAGARALCIHLGLIRTAILHGFDPYKYYMAIFEEIPHCETLEDYERLLPWNIGISKVNNEKMAAAA